MIDRETVIKGIESCRSRNGCDECPYKHDRRSQMNSCKNVLFRDILQLLEEQEPKMVMFENLPIQNIHFFGNCPECNRGLVREKHPKFCGFCGQALKWDD